MLFRVVATQAATRRQRRLPVYLAIFGLVVGQWSAPGSERNYPATQAFQDWALSHTTANPTGAGKKPDLSEAVRLARLRAVEQRDLLEQDPARFVKEAIPEAVRAELPGEIQEHIERRIRGTGFYGVRCVDQRHEDHAEDNHSHAEIIREVVINGMHLRAFTFGEWSDRRTTSNMEIDGIMLGDAIALGSTPPEPSEPVIASAPSLSGPNTLLCMIARFADDTNWPISEVTLLNNMASVSNFFMNNSSGRVSLRGLAKPGQAADVVQVTLPLTRASVSTYNNSLNLLLSDAREAAQAQGFSSANYNLDAVITSGGGFSYVGTAWVGAQGTHLLNTSLMIAGHELGHNLGLFHANSWRTDSTAPFGGDSVPGGYAGDGVNAERVEYGHYFSMMSGQSVGDYNDPTKAHFSAVEKARLGWLSGSQIAYVSSSGTQRLYRHDARLATGTPRAIRIETPATDYTGFGRMYWLNYRYAPWSVCAPWVRSGAQVDVCSSGYGGDGAIQLDMTPFSNDDPKSGGYTGDNTDKRDGMLLLGRTYSDTPAGIHITPVAINTNSVDNEYLDVVINLGSFPENRPPVVNGFSLSSGQAAINGPVTCSVSAIDPDGDALAYSWDFEHPTVLHEASLNQPTAIKFWPTAGQYRVIVTVSDMKGGVATGTGLVTVGTPVHTGQISGRVLVSGVPAYGARVWTTNTTTVFQAWTDADGRYLLTDLPTTNTFFVRCAKESLRFQPCFTNPVSIDSGNQVGRDFLAEQVSLPDAGSRFSISGKVSDGTLGLKGVEIRAGGILTVTDADGVYSFTNLVSGTYAVSARTDWRSFLPASQSVVLASANQTGINFNRSGSATLSGSISGVPAGAQDVAPIIYLSNGRSVTASRQGSGNNKYWAYSFANVPTGQFSVSAALIGYVLAENGFSNPVAVNGAVSGLNFAGTASNAAGTISGKIFRSGLPVTGAAVRITQNGVQVAQVQSDTDGCYRAANLSAGPYVVTPILSGHTFSPSSITVTTLPASEKDFSASNGTVCPVVAIPGGSDLLSTDKLMVPISASASGAAPFTYSWDAISAAGPVSFSPNNSPTASNTVVSFQFPGSYTIRARATAANGLSGTNLLRVIVNSGLASLAIVPSEIRLPAGSSNQFTVLAWDQIGNRLTVAPAWSVTGGGTINSNGLFWAETAGGPFTVEAMVDGLAATAQVNIEPGSTSLNTPPLFQPIADRVVHAGTTMTLSAKADDPDAPAQTMIYNLVEPIPGGATIDNVSGAITWTPPASLTGSTNVFRLRATDSGLPPLSAETEFEVRVVPVLEAHTVACSDGIMTLTWPSIPGATYRVERRSIDASSSWTAAGPDILATGAVATYTESAGVGGLYRVVLSAP